MSELKCPRSGNPCEIPQCQRINEPLSDAVPQIKRALGGTSYNLVRIALMRNIVSEGNSLLVELHPSITAEKTTICPSEVLEGELSSKLGVTIAEQALRTIAVACITDTINDLRAHTIE